MPMVAEIIDPLATPVPPDWDRAAADRRLFPGWYAGVIRAVDWCVPVGSSLVMVREAGDRRPLAQFHARHLRPTNLARFVTAGARPRWPNLAEIRTAPFPLQAGLSFASELTEVDRREAVRVFEQALRRRTGAAAVAYRNLATAELPLVTGPARAPRRFGERLVLDNQWPDLASYLSGLPPKWRGQLQRIRERVDADPGLRVEIADTVEAEPAAWLAEVVRLRYEQGVLLRPPAPALAIAQIAGLPGSRFLTYRDPTGRLLAYTACYDNGEELVLIWWGIREETDGWRRDIYFDQYLRMIEFMLVSGRRRLLLGGGMAHIKTRYGARPEPRWSVVGPAWHPRGRRWSRRTPVAATGGAVAGGAAAGDAAPGAAVGAPTGETAGSGRVGAARPGVLPRWSRWWATRLGRGGLPQRTVSLRCRQCDGWEQVQVLAVGRCGVRYWCRGCGAVDRLADRSVVRPLREFRVSPAPPPAPGVDHPELAELMPAAMRGWLRQRWQRPVTNLDRATMFRVYRQWDEQLRRSAGEPGQAGGESGGQADGAAGGRSLPPFPEVVETLHAVCYEPRLAVAALGPAYPAEPLRERVDHALAWLARYGRELCWPVPRRPGAPLATPDRAAVAGALAALVAGREPDQAQSRAAKAALLGTDRGPSLAVLSAQLPAAQLREALAAYLADGSRPLRQRARQRLRCDEPGDEPRDQPGSSGAAGSGAGGPQDRAAVPGAPVGDRLGAGRDDLE